MEARKPAEGDKSPIEQLEQEHEATRRALDTLTDEVAAVSTGATAWGDVAHHIEESLHALHQLLLVHFAKEEEGLFVEVMDLTTEEVSEAGILAGFFAEQSDDDILAHTTLRMRMQEMERLLPDIRETNGGGQHAARELHDVLLFSRDLFRRHAHKEEEIVFPLMARVLTPEQMAEVRVRIAELIPSA